jgi:hypothetical protein
MIVWGGTYVEQGWVPLDTGGHYDPFEDSWTATGPGPQLPAPRYGHTAVWTGMELIVWGGSGGGNSGGRYCACAASGVPALVPPLLASEADGIVSFGWGAVQGATSYDVVKGTLGALRATAGDFTAATSECLGAAAASPFVSDDEVPAAGDALWYLVRPRNCAGAGTYDSGAGAQAAPRDAEIAASAAACPD